MIYGGCIFQWVRGLLNRATASGFNRLVGLFPSDFWSLREIFVLVFDFEGCRGVLFSVDMGIIFATSMNVKNILAVFRLCSPEFLTERLAYLLLIRNDLSTNI